MAGRGHSTGGPGKRLPGMTQQEKWARAKRKQTERKRNKEEHWQDRRLQTVARGIAKEVPAFAKATQVLAEIEDINEHLSSYFNAGVAVLGEKFPELIEQSLSSALDQPCGEEECSGSHVYVDGVRVHKGDAAERRFLIQKALDLKPLVDSGSFKNQSMMEKMQSLLEEEGTSVVATERKIEVKRD